MLRGIAKSTNAAVATCLFRTGMACIYLGAVLTHRGEATFGEWWNKALNITLQPSGQDSVLAQTVSTESELRKSPQPNDLPIKSQNETEPSGQETQSTANDSRGLRKGWRWLYPGEFTREGDIDDKGEKALPGWLVGIGNGRYQRPIAQSPASGQEQGNG